MSSISRRFDYLRSRYPEDRNFRGSGYATMVSGQLGYEYPGEYEFINMGVGGAGSLSF